MAKNGHGRPRDRLSRYLLQKYPGVGAIKRMACDLQTSPRAARNLFEGHWPGDDTWAAIVRRFGADVLRVVFAPEIDPVLAEIEEREARLARELEGLRAEKKTLAGAREPVAFLLDAGSDQGAAAPALVLFDEAGR